jgi:hypothetical protein
MPRRLRGRSFDGFRIAGTGPAFAGDVTAAKTEADCTKAAGTWNATTNMCEEKKM